MFPFCVPISDRSHCEHGYPPGLYPGHPPASIILLVAITAPTLLTTWSFLMPQLCQACLQSVMTTQYFGKKKKKNTTTWWAI